MKKTKIGLIGTGNMGGALLAGWLSAKVASAGDIRVHDPDPEKLRATTGGFKVKAAKDNVELTAWADVVVLAVKPQVIDAVLREIAPAVTAKKLVISIAAGVPIARIEEELASPVSVVRVMPNTPALIGEGVSALAYNGRVKSAGKKTALQLLDAVGETVEVPEKMIDAVTGLSGSGPAYVFVLLEALSDAGVRQGLPRETANRLAVWTVRGAAGMALQSGRHPGELKDMVTSPGGTTIAGLHALEKGKFRAVLSNAVAAATQRSIELGKEKK
ncbi:MAG: pyrroline-5-carboxylate reductase [Deltaproteobacteria bacterium]|nr:pyrroline-5-carboxylate reductase [Deltaproteobacteria bacterium]